MKAQAGTSTQNRICSVRTSVEVIRVGVVVVKMVDVDLGTVPRNSLHAKLTFAGSLSH
jgi:hypothetical protein